MDSVLVFNIGSSSIRYHRYTVAGFEPLNHGHLSFDFPLESHEEFLKIFRDCLRDIGDISSIKGIGHRVVHGGDAFIEPVVITPEALAQLRSFSHLAPLHNPWNIAGIEACQTYVQDIPNIAVFDTAFFAPLPEEARTYALPQEYAQYRRYGFHGISHSSVAERLAKKLKVPLGKLNFVSCHLGSGASVALIEQGKPIDVSMGFTPLEGLVMMTRPGDVDAGVVFDIVKEALGRAADCAHAQRAIEEIEKKFYKSSGLFALTGLTSFKDILQLKAAKDERAIFAFNVFVRRVRKYIGAYAALVKKLDAICFTGAIGAGDPVTRKAILKDLSCVKYAKSFVFEPEEELAIAKEVRKLI